MDLKRLRYLMRYSAAVDGMDEDIHAIYGSVNTAMDKWLPSEQWQRAKSSTCPEVAGFCNQIKIADMVKYLTELKVVKTNISR